MMTTRSRICSRSPSSRLWPPAAPSAPSRFYTLDSTATADGAPSAHYAVIVGPVSVPGGGRPAAVRRPGRAEPRRGRRIQSLGRTADENIARVVAGDLAVAAGNAARAPCAAGEFRSRLPGDDQHPALRVGAGQAVLIDAVWVRKRDGRVRAPGRTVAREAVPGKASMRSPPRTAARWRRSAPTSPPPSGPWVHESCRPRCLQHADPAPPGREIQ